MRFSNVIRELRYSPWLIDSGDYASLYELVTSRLAQSDAFADDRMSDYVNARPEAHFDKEASIGTIYITGLLGKGFSKIEKSCGNTGYEDILSDIDSMLAVGAEGIVFRFDTGGGHGRGLPEVADRIRELSAQGVATVAYTEDRACSAGYWLAAACDVIVAMRSAELGSIGVIMPWVDSSEQLKQRGLHPMPITNKEADLKGIGYTGKLTEAQIDHLQATAQKLFVEFFSFVSVKRSIPDDAVRGQSIPAGWGVLKDLVDELGDYSHAMDVAAELVVLKSIQREQA